MLEGLCVFASLILCGKNYGQKTSSFIKQLSTTLAKAVESDADAATRIRNLYRKVLLRDPSAAETKATLSYLTGATLEQFAQVLLATNEEVFWP